VLYIACSELKKRYLSLQYFVISVRISKANLKDLSPKIALQHPDDRSAFPIAYSIKYLIDFIDMIYVHLKIISVILYIL
jgi:hypothetical protein